jgi:alkylhydroperoxidase/carboxymuconolactone decarboxylase family protein YurZ
MEQSSNILAIVAIAAVVNWLITYFLIQSATRTNEKIRLMHAQFGLMVEIAKQNGVTQEKVNEIVNQANKR